MRDYWADSDGTVRPAPPAGKKLTFSYPSHAALRAFVFRRDKFTCVKCGWTPENIPTDPLLYLGRYTLDGPDVKGKRRELQLDHKTPRILGGKNLPENLQTLCFGCNAGKQHRLD